MSQVRETQPCDITGYVMNLRICACIPLWFSAAVPSGFFHAFPPPQRLLSTPKPPPSGWRTPPGKLVGLLARRPLRCLKGVLRRRRRRRALGWRGWKTTCRGSWRRRSCSGSSLAALTNASPAVTTGTCMAGRVGLGMRLTRSMYVLPGTAASRRWSARRVYRPTRSCKMSAHPLTSHFFPIHGFIWHCQVSGEVGRAPSMRGLRQEGPTTWASARG